MLRQSIFFPKIPSVTYCNIQYLQERRIDRHHLILNIFTIQFTSPGHILILAGQQKLRTGHILNTGERFHTIRESVFTV